MPILVQAVTNFSGNAGDSNAVMAVASRIPNATVIERKLERKEVLAEFAAAINDTDEYVLVIAGEQGLKFLGQVLQDPKIQGLLTQNRLVISWSGHKTPKNFNDNADKLHVIGLLQEAIFFDTELQARFGRRLVAMDFPPNTLTTEILESGEDLTKWNQTHPHAIIPDSPNGYVTAFLPGDADDRSGTYKFYGPEEARKLGKCLGLEALKQKKFFLATNGPRMGRFDPNSEDLRSPMPRQPLTHVSGAPMDPVTMAFLEGIKDSGLPTSQYRLIDFVAGDSAYKAIACATYKYKDKSTVYYGAESISEAQLGLWFDSYAIVVDVMCDLHEKFLQRINDTYHRVGTAHSTPEGLAHAPNVDPTFKVQFLSKSPEADGEKIATAITTELELLRTVRVAKTGATTMPAAAAWTSAAVAASAPAATSTQSESRASVGFHM